MTRHNTHNGLLSAPRQRVTDLLRTCCRLVSDTANKSATSRCNGIWETTRHNRHNERLPAPTCCGFVVYVADLLWTCYGETDVMDFGLKCVNDQSLQQFDVYMKKVPPTDARLC